MADVDRVVINEPTETENITLEQEAALKDIAVNETEEQQGDCLLYTSPSPRDRG